MRLLAVVLLSAAGAFALELPLKINYQGRLVDPATGNPRNGNFNMTFRLYRAATGGSAVFTETQSNVPVQNGVFSVQLGSAALLSPDLLNHPSAYLSVQVGADSEMAPRQQLVMAPYAYTAVQLMGNGSAGVSAGTAYSTFTSAGNWTMPHGVTAATATFTGTGGTTFSLTTSSGAQIGGSLVVTGGRGVDVTYGVKAATFTGSGAGLTGTSPQVNISSAYATVTLTANAETLAANALITPSSAVKDIWILGKVQFNRVANAVGTCTLAVRVNTAGACGTTSTMVNQYQVSVANTASLSVPSPIFALHSPAVTTAVDYCLTVRCNAAHSISNRLINLVEAN